MEPTIKSIVINILTGCFIGNSLRNRNCSMVLPIQNNEEPISKTLPNNVVNNSV